MKVLGIVLFVLLHLGCFAQTTDGQKYVLQAWKEFGYPEGGTVKNILNFRTTVEKEIKKRFPKDGVASMENACKALSRAGILYKSGKNGEVKASDVKKLLGRVDLSSDDFLQCDYWKGVIDQYYALREVQDGTPLGEAWGKMFFNTSIPTVGNEYDYRKYRRVLEENRPEVILGYMDCLKQVFRYNGLTKGLEELRPYLDRYLPEGQLKQELGELYDAYAHLREGADAPSFSLKNYKGEVYSLEDFRGKVLVIDVWATWCGGCIEKLPGFLATREKYKERDDIEFITISIDETDVFNTWKYATARYKLLELKNLIASRKECDFAGRYNITGIPRYFIIDQNGKIVSVYAPAPGEDFERLINQTLSTNK